MKPIFRLTPVFLLTFFAIFLFIACKKEQSGAGTQDDQAMAAISSESDAEAEIVFNNVFDNVMGANDDVGMSGTGVFGGRISSGNTATLDGTLTTGRESSVDTARCFTVTLLKLTTEPFPVKVVIDFGSGCVGRDGRTRKGKIVTEYTGRLVVPGKKATTVFDGYSVNDVAVSGTHIVENLGTTGAYIFKVTVKEGKLTKPNGNYSQWSSVKTITQVEGLLTPYFALDDAFSVRGESAGTVKAGGYYLQWSSRTLEPLLKKFTCRWIVKGRISVRRSGSDVAVIDYGNGSCDAKATLTIGGSTKEISLH